ncbi:hypothetical protein PRIPAC_80656, partial [Pristionchus pacificus]
RRSNCEGFSLHWDRLSFHIRIRFLLSNVQDWVGEIEIFHSGIRDLDFRALLVVSSCLDRAFSFVGPLDILPRLETHCRDLDCHVRLHQP